MVDVCRFQEHPALRRKNKPFRLKKKLKRPLASLYCLGADPESIADVDGRRPIGMYRAKSNVMALTLTQREADLIALANPGQKPPRALETLHPWLPDQKYFTNSETNLKHLRMLLARYGHHLFAAAAYCDERWNTICNSLRIANGLDSRFYSAWHLPLQNALVLEETRPGRSVIAVDFNSMYAAEMQHLFPDPSGLELMSLHRMLDEDECLRTGLYRCRLGGVTSAFIRKHNPFRSFVAGRHLGSSLAQEITVDLNEFEIEFYRKHFSLIFIEDAVVANRTITHPLAKEAVRSFSYRTNYQQQGNKVLADREKFKMTLLASCANRPGKLFRTFGDSVAALDFLRSNYGIQPHAGESSNSVASWLQGKKGVSAYHHPEGIQIEAPRLSQGGACFNLSQRIVARGRITLLSLMEKIAKLTPTIEICYYNIDSIHFSLIDAELPDVLATLRAGASKEMGGYKIEAVTRHGLWLEPGRYWLYSDRVEKFKNRGIGDGLNPFKDKKIYVTHRLIDGLHIPVQATIDLAGSMTDVAEIFLDENAGLLRQQFVHTGNGVVYQDVLKQLDFNRCHAVPEKLQAFSQLRDRLQVAPKNELPCQAATGRSKSTEV